MCSCILEAAVLAFWYLPREYTNGSAVDRAWNGYMRRCVYLTQREEIEWFSYLPVILPIYWVFLWGVSCVGCDPSVFHIVQIWAVTFVLFSTILQGCNIFFDRFPRRFFLLFKSILWTCGKFCVIALHDLFVWSWKSGICWENQLRGLSGKSRLNL